MACQEVQSWTLGDLSGAFLDLFMAYFVLCMSAFVFFVSKSFEIIWLCLPCPCNGFLGYRNRHLCLHKLLVEWPVKKVYAVQKLVMSRFPFDIRFKDQRCDLGQKFIREVNGVGLEGKSCCSPFSSPRLQSLVDGESGYDAKGKRIVVLKKKTGIRRARRDGFKSPRIFPIPIDPDEGDTRETSGESSIPLAVRDDEPHATEHNVGDTICRTCELSRSAGESKGVDIGYDQDKFPIVTNETDTIRMLQGALEREKAASAALYVELEKERAASATAADEAIAMICRLQKDKASTELEVRQYQRMIEEKFVYDEEEMDVLKEILLRRERENLFLEKEVEAYRQMNSPGNEQSNDSNEKLCDWGQRQTNDTKYNCMDMRNIADSTSRFEASFVEKQIHSNGHAFVEKSVLSAWEEKLHTDDEMFPERTTEALQADTGIENNFCCNGEELQQDGDLKSNCHSAMLDTEPAVYDIHVVDGKTEMLKGESRSSIYAVLDHLDELQDVTCGTSGVCSSLQPVQSIGKGKTPL